MTPRSPEQFEEMRKQTRSSILLSATKLFGTRGFSNTSVEEIAKETNISKGLIYNHFTNKSDILKGVIEDMGNTMWGLFDPIIKLKDPRKKFEGFLNITFDTLEANPEYWRLFASMTLNAENPEDINDYINGMLQGLLKATAELLKEIKFPNPDEESFILGALLDGVSLHYMMDPKGYPLKKTKALISEKYLRYI